MYAHSVLNPLNWSLFCNGSDITGAINSISFGLDPTTNKWVATLTLSANGISGGTGTLSAGNYTLVAHDTIWDTSYNYDVTSGTYSGIALDGDFDGVPGTNPGYSPVTGKTYSSQPGYSISFTVSTTYSNGSENLVNSPSNTGYDQETSAVLGTGTAREQTTRSVAMDHSGDFAVVWTSYGEDDPSDPFGGGVYMRMYDRNNNPLTNDVLVNTYTKGDQSDATVAMDADGDFVVVWQSQGQDPDGSWGIYAQRFNSVGQKVGGEFRVNTNYTNDQTNPAVAMDDYGNFVIVWATTGQPYSYFNDVRGQRFDANGNRVGSEMLINSVNIPGTSTVPGSNEVNPSVAMNDSGYFVVTWDEVTQQTNGVVTDTVVDGRVFDSNGIAQQVQGTNQGQLQSGALTEFQVNVGDGGFASDGTHTPKLPALGGVQSNPTVTDTDRTARNSQVAMDSAGNFIVVWEAFEDNDVDDAPPESYGIYSRRFDIGTAGGNTAWVAASAEDQQANVTITRPDDAAFEAMTPEQQAAYLRFAGDQVNPSIAMDADGDYAIAWNGNGATPNPIDLQDPALQSDVDTAGVWIRFFHAEDPLAPGDFEAVTTQMRVNTTVAGSQQFPSLAMTPDGDVVAVWSGNGVGDQHGIFYRRYDELTDTAGPIVSGLLLPGGKAVSGATQVTQALQAIVVVFDEAMYDNATHSGSAVTNPLNYQLLRNGSLISGGISQIYYGLDEANQLGSQYGLNIPRLNKYEAVLIVDGNGSGPGAVPLSDGQYQIVSLNSLHDAAGNPLRSTGFLPNGQGTLGTINITIPTGQETKVNSDAAYSNTTYGKYTTADTANAVAADADGDYVVAWTDTTPGNQGVWAKMYQQTSTPNADGSRSTSVTALKEMQISADPNASDIAVARDTDGDFVVTWSSWNATTDWDIYAQRFDASGQAKGGIFRVNSTTASTQRYSAVAMDAQGDFVITWQSLNQDGSGYGIYAQVYNALGSAVGGTNETQAIDFSNGFAGTFRLRWDNDDNSATPDLVSAPISYTGNAATTVAAVQAAMTGMGADVNVASNGLTEILIQYTGNSGNSDQQPVWISPDDVVKTSGGATAQVTTKTVTDGVSGEVQVNETTAGDQISPAVAMDAQGNFIITWTSYGQDGDDATQSSICAKRFTSPSYVWSSQNVAAGVDDTPATPGDMKVDTIDNPENHVVPPGSGYDAICQVNSDDEGSKALGSGELLVGGNDTTGYWVLTAAHVVFSESRHVPLMPADITCTFLTSDFPNGVTVQADQVIVNPGYIDDDHFLLGDDLALVHLPAVDAAGHAIPASAKTEAMQIYTDSNEVGQTYHFLGYGQVGSGLTGTFTAQPTTTTLHEGWNVFDTTGVTIGFESTQLCADFDDGTALHDAFGSIFGINDTDATLVAQKKEAITDHGDSGGPALIDGKIAGIESGGTPIDPSPPDIDGSLDSSFGELDVETRISSFASWIDSFTNCLGGNQVIPGTEFVVTKNDVITPQYDPQANEIPYLLLDNETGNQSQSSVAMDSSGDFVIAWTSYGHDGVGNGAGAGVDGQNGIFARRYNADGSMASDAFQVNQIAQGQQQHPKVSMDASGDFVVTWEGNQTGSYDIYARRYARTSLVKYAQDLATTALVWSGENSTYMTDTMTVNAWEVDIDPSDNAPMPPQPYGALILQVNNGAIGGEILVNSTTDGDQRFPSVALDAAGDATVVWSGNGTMQGQEDPQGVFYQRLAQTSDTAGPTVGEVLNVTGSGSTTTVQQLMNNSTLLSGPSKLIITFSEACSIQNGATGIHSILNLGNWQLSNNDGTIVGGVSSVQYGWNEAYNLGLESTASDKWEAVITLDGNPNVAGNQVPGAGSYKLTISSAVQDTFGNAFDGGYTGTSATAYHWAFTVAGNSSPVPVGGNTTPPGDPATGATDIPVSSQYTQLPATVSQVTWDPNGNPAEVDTTPAVASDAAGDFVVVWDRMMNTWDPTAQVYKNDLDVEVQRFNKFGQAQGGEFTANTHAKVIDNQNVTTFAFNGDQTEGTVAMDASGDFVVVWAGTGYDANGNILDASGIFAQIYDNNGKAVGSPFLVNQTTAGPQDDPAVAMDANGDFVVTWTSADPRDPDGGVFARRFNVQGVALTGDIQVNTTTANRQENSDVAMDGSGNFVVVWQSDQQDGNSWGVFGRRFAANGIALSGEMAINTYTTNTQDNPAIAMDPAGDFVVAWQSFGQDGDGYGIYARRYTAAGAAKDANEFRANVKTTGWQITPDVSMANNGMFTITWSGYGQSSVIPSDPTQATVDYGIYAHMYNANGTDYRSTATNNILGEFQVNSTPVGAQSPADAATVAGNVTPAISYGGNGTTLSITWAAPQSWIDNSNNNSVQNYDRKIYARVIVPGSEGPLQQVVLPSPTISSVGISQTSGKISWNVVDPAGMSGCTLKIDGKAMSGIGGPYTATSGWNYSASYGSLGGGTHSYAITATDKGGRSSTLNGTFSLSGTTTVGPTIGGVATSSAKKMISWNAVDSNGVAATSIKIDGTTVLKVNGPYTASSGVNFSASYGALPAGNHSYSIVATDKAGNASTLQGTFNVPAPDGNGPTISGAVVSLTKDVITWNAADPDGIASVALTIDTFPASKIYGPYAAASGFNYSGVMGSLGVGGHNYVITATDKAGNVSTSSGTFTLDTPIVGSGPTISGVVASLAKSKLTWNAADSDGVASVGLTIDGGAVSGINGPYAAAVGANYSWGFGSLVSGTHNYVIRATDKLGNVSTSSGSFTTGSSGSSMSALYAGVSLSALSSSAKLASVYDDLDALAASTQSGSNDSAKAVDAVMAAY